MITTELTSRDFRLDAPQDTAIYHYLGVYDGDEIGAAFNAAGQAVVGHKYGFRIKSIGIGGYDAYTRFDFGDDLRNRLTTHVAGSIAAYFFLYREFNGYQPPISREFHGWVANPSQVEADLKLWATDDGTSDLERALEVARVVTQQEAVTVDMLREVLDAESRAVELLKEHWAVVSRLAFTLVQKGGRMRGRQVMRLLEDQR